MSTTNKSHSSFHLDLKWLLKQFLSNKLLFAEIVFSGFVVSVLVLVLPLFVQVVFDKIIVYKTVFTLNILAISIAILLILSSVLNFLQSYLLNCITSTIDGKVALNIFKHLVYLPIDFFQNQNIGEITKNLLQIEQIRIFFLKKIPEVIVNITSICIFLPILFIYNFKLSLIVVAYSVLIALVATCIITPLYGFINAAYQLESKRQSLLTEAIFAIKTIKSLVLEKQKIAHWDQLSLDAIRSGFQVEKIATYATNTIRCLERLMTLTVIWVGVHEIFSGEMTIGALLAFQLIAGSNISSALLRIVEANNDYQRAALSMRKVNQILGHRHETSATMPIILEGNIDAIEFKEVDFCYSQARKNVLTGINFKISRGEVVGIVGFSGSGKSTIVNLLQGIYQPQSGAIFFNQHDLSQLDIYFLRKRFGIVIQDDTLFSDTILNNIKITKSNASIEEVKEAARLADAEGFIQELPNKYATILDEGGVNLSRGQRQRLAIARAILHNPDILILDEATNALDITSEQLIFDNLKKQFADTSFVIISHRLSLLKEADKIIVLKHGSIEQVGNHKELLITSSSYQELWQQHLFSIKYQR